MLRKKLAVLEELKSNAKLICQQFGLSGKLHFKTLLGGIDNSPVCIYQIADDEEVPVGVFKYERGDAGFANARFSIVEEMTKNGYDFFPEIIKNKDGGYLTQIGSRVYSAIEYLRPNTEHPETAISFIDMLKLTDRYHAHAQLLGERKKISESRYLYHQKRISIVKHVDELNLQSNFFETDKWMRFLRVFNLYSSVKAQKILQSLPKQVIHGDNHQNNLVFSRGAFYNIDLDEMRYDIKLCDFSNMIVHGSPEMFESYIDLAKSGKLFSTLDENYGVNATPLTEDEKQNFSFMMLFTCVEFSSWALSMMHKEPEKYKHLFDHLVDRVDKALAIVDAGLVNEVTFKDAAGVTIGKSKTAMFAIKKSGEGDLPKIVKGQVWTYDI